MKVVLDMPTIALFYLYAVVLAEQAIDHVSSFGRLPEIHSHTMVITPTSMLFYIVLCVIVGFVDMFQSFLVERTAQIVSVLAATSLQLCDVL
jgi:hypothetical protein